VGGLLKGLKMTEDKITVDQLLGYILEDKKMIKRMMDLNERMMASLEDHQLRIGRLEYALANRNAKKVSRNPGDREA
jgi:hypothetical protein